jgi:hypothetical protein
MQPRLRAMILMALSNKFGHLVLSTGNKSELAVGYCTLYGDMAGGLAVISDVPKTMRFTSWRAGSIPITHDGRLRSIAPTLLIPQAGAVHLNRLRWKSFQNRQSKSTERGVETDQKDQDTVAAV